MAEGSKDEKIKFYNAQDGIRGRDGGPYADQRDAEVREEARARAEGREPDFDNLPPFVGNQVVTANFVTDNLFSNPSMQAAPGPAEALNKVVEDANFLVNPDELSVDTRTVLPDSERKAQEEAMTKNAADPANVASFGVSSVGDGGGSNSASAQSAASNNKSAAAKRTAAKK